MTSPSAKLQIATTRYMQRFEEVFLQPAVTKIAKSKSPQVGAEAGSLEQYKVHDYGQPAVNACQRLP